MAHVDGLTHQQRLFAHEYLLDRNGTRAAIRAGYAEGSAKQQGSELLTYPDVRAIVDAGLARLEQVAIEAAELTVADVVRELRGILMADPLDMLGEDGSINPLSKWPQPLRRALSGFDLDKRTNQDGTVIVTKKPRFWSKTESAKQLLMHLGGFERHNEQVRSHVDLVNEAADGGDGGKK